MVRKKYSRNTSTDAGVSDRFIRNLAIPIRSNAWDEHIFYPASWDRNGDRTINDLI